MRHTAGSRKVAGYPPGSRLLVVGDIHVLCLLFIDWGELLVYDLYQVWSTAIVLHQAKDISTEMGGLPLALDQAGVYIEETIQAN